jgi:hypothetical protein
MQEALSELAPRRPRRHSWVATVAHRVRGASGTDSGCNGEGGSSLSTIESAQTEGFLGPDDFEGDSQGQPQEVEYGGQATYLGRVIFLHLARTTVDDVLPEELELAPNLSATLPERHPVVLLVGHQTETQLVYPFWTPDVGEDYREVILMIPFVRKTGGYYWHNYIVRMYLEDFEATVLGNQYYGLQKIQADFAETPDTLEVILNSISMFTLKATPNGDWLSDAEAEAALSNYTQMKEIVGMPILGRLDYMIGKPFICSYFEWMLDEAQVRPITATARFVQPFVTGMASWQALGDIPSVAEGAWEIEELRWRIGYPPFGCGF